MTAEQRAKIEAGKRAAEERRRNGDPTIRPHKRWKLTAPRKSAPMSAEARAHISEALKGRKGRALSPEHKAKLAAGRTAEAAKKREAGIKRTITPEHIAALAQGRERAKQRIRLEVGEDGNDQENLGRT